MSVKNVPDKEKKENAYVHVQEIERRFVVFLKDVAEAYPLYTHCPSVAMDIAYTHDGVRYRKEVHSETGTTYPVEGAKQEIKGAGYFSSIETVMGELAGEEAFLEKKKNATTTLVKTRYLLPYACAGVTHTVCLDVFPDLVPYGVCIAEVEFPSVEVAHAFVPPPWCGRELVRGDGLSTRRIGELRVYPSRLKEAVQRVLGV